MKIIIKLQELIRAQDSIINEFNSLQNVQDIEPITKFNIDSLECIEKCYSQLWMSMQNLQKIIDHNKTQMGLLKNYSSTIRSNIREPKQVSNDSRFIEVLQNTHYLSDSALLRRPSSGTQSVTKTVNFSGIDTEFSVTNSLKNINDMFNWYDGDHIIKKGLYVSVCEEFSVQVPFPDVISKASPKFKHKSVPCKYKDLNNCISRQNDLSKKYGTENRTCNYVHAGERFIKIGSDFRCPNLPSFGAHDTLKDDIANITFPDIKWILMNAVSDILLIRLWYESHKHLGKIVLMDLDKL